MVLITTSVILLNLLIAMMGSTYEDVKEKSDLGKISICSTGLYAYFVCGCMHARTSTSSFKHDRFAFAYNLLKTTRIFPF